MIMVPIHRNRNPNCERGCYQKQGIAMVGLIMLSFGGIQTLVLWVRKAIECFKYFLMGHTSRNMEDNGVENNLNCWGLAQKYSKENFSMLLESILLTF